MIYQNTIVRISLILLSLFISMPSAYAADVELCTPFKNTQVDQSLVAGMLEAAEDGYLYQIIPGSSKMGFCVESPLGLVTGDFKNFKGGIALKEPGNQTLISIDVSSIEANIAFIENLLKSDEFFHADKYPDMVFVSSGFEWMTDTKGVIHGELTLHGVTKTVAFYVEIIEGDAELGDAQSITVKATTTIQRSEFGMHNFSSMAADKVNLCMTVEAERYMSL